MTKALNKITLSSSRDIPFNKLTLSQANVRRVKAGVSVEELAEDIARRTLLQSLSVRPVLDEQGQETGMFEIPAGGRRYRALELLVKQKRLARTALVPCVVRDAACAILAEDDSLAENILRAPLHPLDQFRAFAALREKGQSEEEIAAAFFVGVTIVSQRLRLAAVSPKLLELYEADEMTLQQLMAFTVSPDHQRQEQVWAQISSGWNREPYHIRRQLTEGAVSASDKRARFVGMAAYEQAGGVILRDLFTGEQQGWFTDVALLDSMTADKLRTSATELMAEGWKWVEAHVTVPYGHAHQLRAISGTQNPLSPEGEAAAAALTAEYQALEAEYAEEDEIPAEVEERLQAINRELVALDDRPLTYDRADVAMAGAFISLGHDGTLTVERGFVRPNDEPQAAGPEGETATTASPEGSTPVVSTGAAPHGSALGGAADASAVGGVIVHGGEMEASGEDDDDALRPLSDRLLGELSASRTLALRHAISGDHRIAMTALLHRLVIDAFFHRGFGHCVEIGLKQVYFTQQPEDVRNSLPARELDQAHQDWQSGMPQDEDALWDWIGALDDYPRQALLAHCVALSLNALHEKTSIYGQGAIAARLAHADRLARALRLDMINADWQPTVANYLGRVPKRRILEAVREAKGEASVQLIEHLKKDEMAREAERLLQNSRWLPEPLRLAELETPPATAEAGTAATDEALPDFLAAEDDEDGAEIDDEHLHAVAAE